MNYRTKGNNNQYIETESEIMDKAFIDGAVGALEILHEKNDKLKQLLLLTDSSVSNITVGDTQLRQWNEYIKCFPNEGGK